MKNSTHTPTPDQIAAWENEFMSGNDRATVIVAAARLDALLELILADYLLLPRLKSGEEDQLLSKMRPLSSFSSRIYAARRLALIDERFEDALHVVRDLRNTMAHEPFTNVSLNEQPHKDRVQKLYACFAENDIVKFVWEKMGQEAPKNYSGQFRVMMTMLLWALTKVKATTNRLNPNTATTLRILRYKRVGSTQVPMRNH